MKIGIMTYWDTVENYGQLLQCYALQKILKNMGHEPYFIRHHIVPRFLSRMKILVFKILAPLFPSTYRAKRVKDLRGFVEFKKREMAYTPCVYRSLKQLQTTPPPYILEKNEQRCYIVGSDVIWFWPVSEREREAYFLNFGGENTKRIAFAPSFGRKEYPEEANDKLRENLARLDYVSCRERAGVEICEKVGIKAEHISDPTIVAPISFYTEILEENKYSKPYCFIYSVNISSPEEMRFKELRELVDRHGLQIVVTTSNCGGDPKKKEFFDDVTYDYATVGCFLANVKYAEFVVTASFHGIVFSVLFHKPFVYTPLKGWSGGNNRILDFLDNIGLSEHVLTDDKNYEDLLKIPYDWKAVDEKIAELRKKAMNYLEKALA